MFKAVRGRASHCQHGFADDFDGSEALAHEGVVEGLQVEGGALFGLHVGAELHDFEFAEGVVEVGGIAGAALGFDEADGGRLVALGDEEVDGLVDGPCAAGLALTGVQLDGVDEAGVAQECVLQLARRMRRPGGAGRVWRRRVRRRSPGRASSARSSGPSLDVGVGAEDLADVRGELRHEEELDVVAGVGLMHGGRDDGADVEAGHVFGDVLRGPVFFGEGDVEVGLR